MEQKSRQQKSPWIKSYLIIFSIIVILAVVPISRAGDFVLIGQEKGVTQVKSGKDVLFKSSRPVEAIEWAMEHNPITVVGAGTYTLSSHISIPRPNVSLVIVEGAELVTAKDAKVINVTEKHGNYYPLIHNAGHDNVNVINFGTLDPSAHHPHDGQVNNVCIIYDGRNSGANGIEGGMIFSCGKLLTDGDAVWIVDSKNVRVPLIWCRSTGNTLAIEGSDDISIGTVAELNIEGRPKGKGRHGNEAIDLNSFCRRIHCDLAIGTAAMEETVDINNSPDCTFEDVRAYGGGRAFSERVYPPTGRRLTQKSYIDNSDGTEVKKDEVIAKKIKSWETDFEVKGLLKNLPIITVDAKLNGVFEDGTEELMFCKRWNLNLAPGGKWKIGTTFPSERKVVKDPVTGVDIVFLTSKPAGDSKIYQTHNQWTSDGKWIIFRSKRAGGEAMAVNEATGEMVVVTEGGYDGALNVAYKSMKLYFLRKSKSDGEEGTLDAVEVDLGKLFADVKAGSVKDESAYQRICATVPGRIQPKGGSALDADEEWLWFSVGKEEAAIHLPEGTKIEPNFGPRDMGEGPGGIAGVNLKTGEVKHVISVGFKVGHIQSNPWVSGQIVFCWETGGKSSQRTWIVNSDGTGLRPLYPESDHEWITHEVIIGPDEVALAIMGHRAIPGVETDEERIDLGQEPEWGPCGSREKPTGLGIVNIKTREMYIAGQPAKGSGFWHVGGSPDGRYAVGDDFDRNLFLIDRSTNEMVLLTAGHKTTAGHVHPSISYDSKKVQFQSAMLSEDDKSLNICVIEIPENFEELRTKP